MRLFVALSIPAALRENLSSLIRELKRADGRPRWVNPDNLHITLKFIGEVSSDNLAAIGEALKTVRTPLEANLEFRGVGFFPNARKPAVAWIAIEPSSDLVPLAAEINRALAPLGIPREEKPFVPHLTIARFKEARLSAALEAEVGNWRSHSFGTLRTGAFHLVESRLKGSGAEYTTLRSFRFAPEESESRKT